MAKVLVPQSTDRGAVRVENWAPNTSRLVHNMFVGSSDGRPIKNIFVSLLVSIALAISNEFS